MHVPYSRLINISPSTPATSPSNILYMTIISTPSALSRHSTRRMRICPRPYNIYPGPASCCTNNTPLAFDIWVVSVPDAWCMTASQQPNCRLNTRSFFHSAHNNHQPVNPILCTSPFWTSPVKSEAPYRSTVICLSSMCFPSRVTPAVCRGPLTDVVLVLLLLFVLM